MQRFLIGLILIFLPIIGSAQVHKCSVEGKPVYQQMPCTGSMQPSRPPTKIAPSGGKSATSDSIPILWSKVAGKTSAEVLRLVPGSLKEKDDVTLEDYRFADKIFSVRFSFTSDRLNQLHLTNFPVMELNAETRTYFEKLVGIMRNTYGEPQSRSVEERSSGLYGEATWAKSGSKVSVSIFTITQMHSSILINFFAR